MIDLMPLTVCIIALTGFIIWALTGCAERRAAGYSSRDELRASCASAAHAYLLAVERTRAGEMSAAIFRQVDDGYAGVLTVCRRVLEASDLPTDQDAATVRIWTRGAAEAAL